MYENPLRARRIKVEPDNGQKQTLLGFFGAVRFAYNMLVTKFPDPGKGGVTLKDMRAIVHGDDTPQWLKDIHYEIRDCAVTDFNKARKAHFAKLKKKKQNDPTAKHEAKFKFRSKRDSQQSFELRARDWGRSKGVFASLFGKDKIKATEELPETPETTIRVIGDRLGRFYFAVPRQVTARSESQAPSLREGVVALDPGVRTFQTTYDADGLVSEWGKGDMKRIFQFCHNADNLQSKWKEAKGGKRCSIKLAWHRVQDRVKNLVKELHRKLASWLCETYHTILIPVFETSRMVKRGKRKINNETARGMMTWSHYSFRQLLKNKAELFPWVNVVECKEPYTSKTCGRCGTLHHKLGGSKTFCCPSCRYVADRDVNAARNILLRQLTLFA